MASCFSALKGAFVFLWVRLAAFCGLSGCVSGQPVFGRPDPGFAPGRGPNGGADTL